MVTQHAGCAAASQIPNPKSLCVGSAEMLSFEYLTQAGLGFCRRTEPMA